MKISSEFNDNSCVHSSSRRWYRLLPDSQSVSRLLSRRVTNKNHRGKQTAAAAESGFPW